MNFSAIVSVAQMAAANTTLEELGYGPNNFQVPAFNGANPGFGLFHAWADPTFEAAVAALPGVTIQQGGTTPAVTVDAACLSVGAQWAASAPQLPDEGMVLAGNIYWYNEVLWAVVQSFDRTAFPLPPETYPALMMQARVPGVPTQWRQPLGSFDAYVMVEPFTGLPEQVYHNNKLWTNNTPANVWEPGTGTLWLEVTP